MRSIWLLSGCTTSEIRRIRSSCTRLDVPEGKVLVQQGEGCSQFFIVARGTAVVSLDRRPVALIEAGSFVGDMVLTGRGVHRVTITAATPMELLIFSRRECDSLAIRPIPSMAAKIDTVRDERRAALAAAGRSDGATSLDQLRDLPVLQDAAT